MPRAPCIHFTGLLWHCTGPACTIPPHPKRHLVCRTTHTASGRRTCSRRSNSRSRGSLAIPPPLASRPKSDASPPPRLARALASTTTATPTMPRGCSTCTARGDGVGMAGAPVSASVFAQLSHAHPCTAAAATHTRTHANTHPGSQPASRPPTHLHPCKGPLVGLQRLSVREGSLVQRQDCGIQHESHVLALLATGQQQRRRRRPCPFR